MFSTTFDAGNLHVRFDEDNSDRGGNGRQVIFDGHPDNLHWVENPQEAWGKRKAN
jgi:hypothetical protein